MKTFNFLVRLVVAVILLQTLYFKFGGVQESVDLFTKIVGPEHEAYLRITTGVLELIAGLLLLSSKGAVLGALTVVGLMLGAILSHILFLGIDGLFVAAVVALLGALYTLWVQRDDFNLNNLK